MSQVNLEDLIIGLAKDEQGTDRAVEVGIGDDGAVIAHQGRLVVCCDTLNVGTHFLEDQPAESVGFKAFAVNLSDIAAMGGQARWALVSISIPDDGWQTWATSALSAFLNAAKSVRCQIIGGDTTRGAASLTATLIGDLAGPALRRGSAGPGDDLWVTGTLGDARWAWSTESAGADLIERLHFPQARWQLGAALGGVATSAMDISDGLISDLPKLLPSGHGAMIDGGRLPVSDPLAAAAGADAIRIAILGGDDYELLFTAPKSARAQIKALGAESGTPVTCIGEVCRGSIRYVDARGKTMTFDSADGFQHFGSDHDS